MKWQLTLIRYEIIETMRQAFTWLTPLLFFVIVICLFPLALGPTDTLLHAAAPGIIWVTALLAVLLSIGNVFTRDQELGYTDLLLLSSHSLTTLVLGKIISHWLIYCLPLVLISPLLGLILQLAPAENLALVISLLLGTPVLSLLGSIGAALTVGIRGHGLLLPVLILPLYLPVLILGMNTITAVNNHLSVGGYYAMMGALVLVSLVFSPFFASAALRLGVNQ